MSSRNEMTVSFTARSENESFARMTIAAFAAQLDPTLEQLSDIKTAVSEAVTNAIIHGYDSDMRGIVTMTATVDKEMLYITINDDGAGIEDVELAREPLFTSKPELERSGMGFTIMESFMDRCEVISEPGKGTMVVMAKRVEAKKPMYN